MININTFYKGYQVHHHRAKAKMILKLLETKDFLKPEDIIEPIWSFSEIDLERMLKMEMRANLFHAIDTLFTLYFCLQPNQNNEVDDFGLFRNLNKRNFYYEQIREIADKGIEALTVFDKQVKFGDLDVNFGQYLFYYGFKQEKFPQGLEDSINAIKTGLILLANEMTDTAEYNSYKHSLRSIPALTEFAFVHPGSKEIQVSFDLSNSITFFQEFKDESFSYTTKIFDTARDYKMTILASNFIYHIMTFRRASLVRDNDTIPLGYFDKEAVELCAKRNEKVYQFINTFTPIK